MNKKEESDTIKSQDNLGIEKDSIQETMLGPLWARATYSQKLPELLNDEKAINIIKNINYDFSEMEQHLGEWRSIGLMIRARRFDDALKDYLKKYPSATVVNIGAGLDTTFYRIDNGKITFYNLDLPNVIDYRERFIEETDRNQNIAQSAFDYSWMDKLNYSQENGIFFIAGGFIYYFDEQKVINFVNELATRFPGGQLIFDAISSLAQKKANKRAEKANSELRLRLNIDDPYEIVPKWSDHIKIEDSFVIGNRTSVNKKWSFKTKIMNRLSYRLKTARIIHLSFC